MHLGGGETSRVRPVEERHSVAGVLTVSKLGLRLVLLGMLDVCGKLLLAGNRPSTSLVICARSCAQDSVSDIRRGGIGRG